MVDYVTAYRARGNSVLVVYDDKPSKTAAAEVFDSMLSRSPYMYAYAPSLERYLRNYPNDRSAGVRETLFWSEDDLPTTLTITHQLARALGRAFTTYSSVASISTTSRAVGW